MSLLSIPCRAPVEQASGGGHQGKNVLAGPDEVLGGAWIVVCSSAEKGEDVLDEEGPPLALVTIPRGFGASLPHGVGGAILSADRLDGLVSFTQRLFQVVVPDELAGLAKAPYGGRVFVVCRRSRISALALEP